MTQDINVVVNPQIIHVTIQSVVEGGSATTLTLTGDVTGTGQGTVVTTLSNSGVTAGSYQLANVTIDSKGRVTNASDGIPLAIALAIAL